MKFKKCTLFAEKLSKEFGKIENEQKDGQTDRPMDRVDQFYSVLLLLSCLQKILFRCHIPKKHFI